MNSRKPETKAKRMVWRISEAAPMGEWVDPSLPERHVRRSTEAPDSTSGTWVSTYDLLEGSSVSEDVDTVPAPLADEMFVPNQKPAKK